MKRKYLDKLGVPKENRPDSWGIEENDSRMKRWKKQRKKYGFDDRETWALNTSFYCWLYERIKMYIEIGGKVVKLDYHTFDVDGETYTQIEILNMILEYLEIALLKDDFTWTDEERKKVDKIGYLWGIVLPAMWW